MPGCLHSIWKASNSNHAELAVAWRYCLGAVRFLKIDLDPRQPEALGCLFLRDQVLKLHYDWFRTLATTQHENDPQAAVTVQSKTMSY